MTAWQRMLMSGRRLNLVDPSPLDIEIVDIAHGLARIARWNGQTTGKWPMSVAEHSLLVERVARAYRPGLSSRWQLAALLHDGPEYVLGDMLGPLKKEVGKTQAELEARLQDAIHQRFGLPHALPAGIAALVKRSDRAVAYVEGTQLAGYDRAEAARNWGRPRLAMLRDIKLAPLPAAEAETAFQKRFEELWRFVR